MASMPALAQTDSVSINTIVDKTQKYLDSRPTEKVYMHLDKPYYAVGDSIWFKCYVAVDLHQPSPLSKIVYVEVLAKGDSLVQFLKLPVQNSMATGCLPLVSTNYQQGNYRIRAYTKWMTNSDPSYFFDKTIAIGNAIENKVLTKITYSNAATGKNGKLAARILYQDQQSVAYANKKVNWTVQNQDGTVMKGKGTTDASGYFNVSLNDNKSTDISNATLVTTLELESRKAVTRTFPLRTGVNNYDVQFFPEGGDLIEGVNSVVAFKAIKPDGFGTDIKGTLTDNEGKTLATISAQHLGMGLFTFTPESGKTYKVNVVFPDGSQNSYTLPKAKTSGVALRVNTKDPAKVILKISANEPYFQANQNKSVYIIAQCSGAICYAARATLKQQLIPVELPKDKLKAGTIQITVLSTSGEALCERLAFVWKDAEMLNVSVSTDKPSYTRRQKVQLNISAKAAAAPAEGNFSVSVVDETKTPFDDNASSTILTNLLLQSDVKGYVEKPNYYFNRTDEKKLGDLDLVMLTQGYRRFSYKGVLAGTLPPYSYLPEQGMEISGTLRTLNGMPVKGGNVRIVIPNKNYSANAVTNVEGEFKFSNLAFEDSSQVTINARNNVRANNLMLMMNNTSGKSPGLPPNPNVAEEVLNIDSALNPYLQNSKRVYDNSHQLREVVIKSTAIPKTTSHRDYPSLSGLSSQPDHLVTSNQLGACNNFLMCASAMLPGITYDNGAFYITRDYNSGNRTPTQVFVKGMPVDVTYLNSINMSEIESVEIFLKDELGTVNRTYNSNGAIVINMKKIETKRITLAELQQLAPPPYIINMVPKGFDEAKEFYSPRYEVKQGNIAGNDLRTTIYWNPNVNTFKTTGAATLSFYNADSKGTYKIIVEGWDKEGNLGRSVYRIKVE
ncbi:carboxypeptidase-like regulatory domain-containing protein [Mucilaginibacter lacusdianchii]|uniref:carboxypeptidase-like regulatory domain-containing protein n=1 Tax=Mucilaginibacter lacusdianchii TaxID=2684211 RepID=UPI00131EA8D1|nr:carboxypeptidase-like regulatory domain-containing protein [Mucilaginibacter sp. JXJ CY 39]